MKLSGIILTKNEEGNIKDAIKSLDFADEIIVVDDDSVDKTREYARQLKAKVFPRPLNGDFASQRNFALQKVLGDWVLFLDADERVDSELKEEIISEISRKNNSYDGYLLKRQDIFAGKKLKHGETASLSLLRLGKRGAGKWARQVHEVWNVAGKTKTLKGSLLHYSHPNLKEFVSDINFLSGLDALAKKKEGKKSNIVKIVVWPAGKFFYNFVIRLGFLDGTAGFVMALIMSLHSFLSWGKLYFLERKLE